MYAGAAAASLAAPALVAAAGPEAVTRAAGALGLLWLVAWRACGGAALAPRGSELIPTASTPASPKGKGAPRPTPWARLAASPAVWAITASNFAFHYAFYVVMNWMPAYYGRLLGAPLGGKGTLSSALPYALMFLASNAGGAAGDALAGGDPARVGRARKTVNSVGEQRDKRAGEAAARARVSLASPSLPPSP